MVANEMHERHSSAGIYARGGPGGIGTITVLINTKVAVWTLGGQVSRHHHFFLCKTDAMPGVGWGAPSANGRDVMSGGAHNLARR